MRVIITVLPWNGLFCCLLLPSENDPLSRAPGFGVVPVLSTSRFARARCCTCLTSILNANVTAIPDFTGLHIQKSLILGTCNAAASFATVRIALKDLANRPRAQHPTSIVVCFASGEDGSHNTRSPQRARAQRFARVCPSCASTARCHSAAVDLQLRAHIRIRLSWRRVAPTSCTCTQS